MTFIPGADYFVHWIRFPPNNGTDGGMVMLNEDGTFTILLDERLLYQKHKAKKAYRHEVEHIEHDDFYNSRPIQDIEKI